jgi:hypothetical protein
LAFSKQIYGICLPRGEIYDEKVTNCDTPAAIRNLLWENTVTNISERRRGVTPAIEGQARIAYRKNLVPSSLRTTESIALHEGILQLFPLNLFGRLNIVDIFTLIGENLDKETRLHTQSGIQSAFQTHTHFIVSEEDFSR